MQGTSCAVLVNVYDQTKCKIIVIAMDSVYCYTIMKGSTGTAMAHAYQKVFHVMDIAKKVMSNVVEHVYNLTKSRSILIATESVSATKRNVKVMLIMF